MDDLLLRNACLLNDDGDQNLGQFFDLLPGGGCDKEPVVFLAFVQLSAGV